MTAPLPHAWTRRSYLLVLAVFFASGLSALVYQVVWVQMLNTVFGVTTFAASAVLGAYFGGLALGGAIGGRAADAGGGLRLYAAIEIVLGLVALAVPLAFDHLTGLYRAIYDASSGSLVVLVPARFVLSFVVLAVPATLIGMTLPVLVRVLTSRYEELGDRLPRLYGWNTFGSMLGALLTGYLLIGLLGVLQTMYIAVAINFAAGGVALWASRVMDIERRPAVEPARVPAEPGSARGAQWRRAALVATFCSGFASLGYEVAWFRVLTLLSDHRAHTFSAIVALVLLGIGAGSLVMARLSRRAISPALLLAVVMGGLGAAGLLWLPLVAGLSWAFSAAASLVAAAPTRSGVPLAVALLVTLAPCVLMGMSFPLAVLVYTRHAEGLGRSVGRMYALNLVGATAGSVVTGFLLLPILGAQRTMVSLALVAFLAAGVLLQLSGARMGGRAVAAAAAATVALMLVPGRMFDLLFTQLYPRAVVLESYEDIEATVTVADHDATRVMYINGAHQADNSPSTLRVHRLIGLIPCLVHPAVEHALVVGMGGGATSGAIAPCTGTSLTIVEISPGVVAAARAFAAENGNIVDSPMATTIVADGRNYLLLTDRRFDLMTADTIRPIHAHSGHLYSHDYYRLMSARLAEGGLVLQWVDVTLRDHEERILMRSFVSAFPFVAMSELGGSRFLLGSLQPLRLDREAIVPRLTPERLADLAEAGVGSAEEFLASFVEGDALREAIGDGPVVTDDRPINEHFTLLRVADLWRRLPAVSAAYRPGP